MLPNEEPQLNVGIIKDKKIEFELHGDFRLSGYKENLSGVFTAGLKNNSIICSSGKHNLQAEYEIEFIPADPESESFLIKDVTIGKKFHWERKEKQRFNHTLKIIKDGDYIVAINIIPLEDYLTSVISSEMSAKSSVELLKAQAVVARSWVLSHITKPKKQNSKKEKQNDFSENDEERITWYDRSEHKLFDVCADDHCQRFQGVTKIISDSAFSAIERTRGIILLHNKEICDTRYSKCCGGITESFENVWEPDKHEYLTSVVDYKYEPENFKTDFGSEKNARKWITGNPPAFCNTKDIRILSHILVDYDRETKDFYRWKTEYTQKEISGLIHKNTSIDFGDILDIVPLERGSSARLIKMKIIGTKKSLIVGKELEIRRILSQTHLYSSAFVVDKTGGEVPDKFIIRGAGWGHGVGFCQIGGAVMAEKGYMFDEILLHYFQNAVLKRIY